MYFTRLDAGEIPRIHLIQKGGGDVDGREQKRTE